ncbi:MAG: CdaR family protein [Candidatus Zipacnadales bacterium]
MNVFLRGLCYNWPLKLAALGLGIVLWAVVLLKTNPWETRPFEVPVEPRYVPQDLQVMSITPARVTVTLAGRQRTIRGVAEKGIQAFVNLKGREVGEHDIPVRLDLMTLPQGTEVRDLATYTVRVTLERTVEQQRAVLTEFRGRAAPGFATRPGRPRPNEVTVKGPQSVVQGVAGVYAVVDVSGIKQSRTFTSRLEARDARGMPQEGVTIYPTTVQVEVTVERINVKTVPVLLTWGSAPLRAVQSVTISPPTVLITGRPEVLDRVTFVATEPVVAQDDVVRHGVPLRFPEGVSPVSDSTVSVSIQVETRRLPIAPARRSSPPVSSEEETQPSSEGKPPPANETERGPSTLPEETNTSEDSQTSPPPSPEAGGIYREPLRSPSP